MGWGLEGCVPTVLEACCEGEASPLSVFIQGDNIAHTIISKKFLDFGVVVEWGTEL